ncbi:MAG: exosortase-associated EpsI family protein [Coraliomargaritaceae bacterium]
MKKLILVSGTLLLIVAFGLRAYFAFVPPPDATLEQPLSEIFPAKLEGWTIQEQDMATSPESSNRISEFLNFDDALFRTYEKSGIFIGLYVAYWKPGTASYRWAGAHTPDTCWIVNGWTCSERQYAVPFTHKNTEFQPAEFGVYEKDGSVQSVYFWHLVGGEVMTYDQKGTPEIFGALVDIQKHGLNLRQEQFFIRLSSNRNLQTLKKQPEFSLILDGLSTLGL